MIVTMMIILMILIQPWFSHTLMMTRPPGTSRRGSKGSDGTELQQGAQRFNMVTWAIFGAFPWDNSS